MNIVNLAKALQSIHMAERKLANADLSDGQVDGKISGSIWNELNPDAPIDEKGFKDVKEALTEKRAAILEQYGITEEELQAAEDRLKKNKLETIEKDLEQFKEKFEKTKDGDVPKWGPA